jgi:hypothetical protein
VDGSSTGTLSAIEVVADGVTRISGEPNMQAVTTIGLDIAKSVFQSMALTRRAMWFSPAAEASLCAGVLP